MSENDDKDGAKGGGEINWDKISDERFADHQKEVEAEAKRRRSGGDPEPVKLSGLGDFDFAMKQEEIFEDMRSGKIKPQPKK